MMKKDISFIVMFFLAYSMGCGSSNLGKTVFVTQPISQSVSEGQSVSMSVVVNGRGPFHYQWMKDAVAVGADDPAFSIESAATSDAGTYAVAVKGETGTVTSDSAVLSVVPSDLSDRSFTIGVWLQDSADQLNGKSIPQNYRDIGVNTYVGLWNWPTEDWAYPGYTMDIANSLKDAGMKAYAGNDQAAVDWINAHPEFQETVVGYLLGDEPDMNRNSGIQEERDANTPDAWKAKGDALRALDAVRPIYANFGKPLAKDVWYGDSEYGNTGSQLGDFEHYISPTTVFSSDLYAITDPWEAPENHGIWVYGRTIRNNLKYAGTRPVWGFLEASGPWTDESSDNWMYQKMQPHLIMPIVWNMVINGAQGILYFCHDFTPGPGNKGVVYAPLLETGIPEAMKAANESVMAYGKVLQTAGLAGVTAVTDGAVEVVVLTKNYSGDTYIFAMSDGNSDYRESLAVDAVIAVSGETGTKTVQVLNDLRSVTMTDGSISDHFEPYELHIYKIDH